MTSLKISAPTLTNRQMNLGIDSYTGSLSYMKILIPVGVTNILHNRINYPAESFNKHVINTIPYIAINNKIRKSHPLYTLHFWLKSAMVSLSKKYLKELFIIIRKKDTKEILEHYRFTVKYDPDDDNVLPTGQSVIDATANFLNDMNELGENVKYDYNNVSLAMQVTLNEDAPKDYITPTFEQCETGYIDTKDKSSCMTLASINTGHHKLKVFAKGQIFEIYKTAEEDKIDETIKDNVENKDLIVAENKDEVVDVLSEFSKENDAQEDLVDINVADDVMSLSEFTDCVDDTLHCICKISKKFDTINEIACSDCQNLLHTACIGYRSTSVVPSPYICFNCCTRKNIKTKDFRMGSIKQDKLRTVMAQFRLAVLYGYNTDSSPVPVLNNISKEYYTDVIDKLKKTDSISCKGSQINIKKNMIEKNVLKQIFCKEIESDRLETMVIEGEDTENSVELTNPTRKRRILF